MRWLCALFTGSFAALGFKSVFLYRCCILENDVIIRYRIWKTEAGACRIMLSLRKEKLKVYKKDTKNWLKVYKYVI